MNDRTNDDAGLAPGVKNTKQTDLFADYVDIFDENQSAESELTTKVSGVA
jgi:hypothetical protein